MIKNATKANPHKSDLTNVPEVVSQWIPYILTSNNKHHAVIKPGEYSVINERWKRIRLFIISDSTILQQHFYNTMEQFWLSLIGVPKENLSEADYLDFTFILHGAISIIKMQTEHYNLDFLKTLPDRALGQGIIQTLENLIIKYHA